MKFSVLRVYLEASETIASIFIITCSKSKSDISFLPHGYIGDETKGSTRFRIPTD